MTENQEPVLATNIQILAAKTFQERQNRIAGIDRMIFAEKENFELRKFISERKISDLEAEKESLNKENEIMIKEYGLVPGDNIAQNDKGQWVITKSVPED